MAKSVTDKSDFQSRGILHETSPTFGGGDLPDPAFSDSFAIHSNLRSGSFRRSRPCPMASSRNLTRVHPFPPNSCSRWRSQPDAASASGSRATIWARWDTTMAPCRRVAISMRQARGPTENEQLRISICQKLPK